MKLTLAQKNVVKEILSSFKNKKNFLLSWYTGSGKTNIFLEIIEELTKNNPKVKIGVSCYMQRNIKIQTVERADEHYDFHSQTINSFSKIDPASKVFFFNPQVFFKKPNNNLKFDYLIIDEAHVGLAESTNLYDYLIENFCHSKTRFLLASATPWDVLENPLVKESKMSMRSMEVGVQVDKFLTNFKINIEGIDLKLKRDNFSRTGDIKETYVKANFELFKKITTEKALSIISKKNLGQKTLIIVPPGNKCEIASELAKLIGDSALCLVREGLGKVREQDKETFVINEFKNNPKIKFLIVVNKCQLGFDMPNLTSTIDLTMTRNIKLLIQRWGRLARIDRSQHLDKKYFYVIDNLMSSDEAEWILGTSVEYAMGAWVDNHRPNRSIFRKKTKIFGFTEGFKEREISLEDLMLIYKGQTHRTHKEMSFIENSKLSGYWTKELLLKKVKEYKSRTELSEKNRYLYNKLKKLYPEDLNILFPYLKKPTEMTKEDLVREAKKYKTRGEFKGKYRGYKNLSKAANEVFGLSQKQVIITVEEALKRLKGHKPTSFRQVRDIAGHRAEEVLRDNKFTIEKINAWKK